MRWCRWLPGLLLQAELVGGLDYGLDAVDDVADADAEHTVVDARDADHEARAARAVRHLEVLWAQDWVWLQHPHRDAGLGLCLKRYVKRSVFRAGGILENLPRRYVLVGNSLFEKQGLHAPAIQLNIQCVVEAGTGHGL